MYSDFGVLDTKWMFIEYIFPACWLMLDIFEIQIKHFIAIKVGSLGKLLCSKFCKVNFMLLWSSILNFLSFHF